MYKIVINVNYFSSLQDEVKQLSFAVCEKVYDIGHGVGDRPVRSA